MGFGEFESALHKNGSTVGQAFTIVQDIFTSFHPAKRPVRGDTTDRLTVRAIPVEDRERFYWKKEPTDVDRQKMEEQFTVAEAYLSKKLPGLWNG
jgi:hypothetical protein